MVADVEKHHQHQHLQKDTGSTELEVVAVVPEEMVQVVDLVAVDLVLL